MARLFVTSREIQFINDVTKEVIKDVIGQQIIYYPISTMKTQVHPVYEEAIEKIFENPIRLDVLAGQPNWETKWNQFGNEQTNKFELYVQARDLLDKGYKLSEGDFFLYGDQLYELITFVPINNIYGQVEYTTGYKLEGKVARKGQFDVNSFKDMLKDQGIKYIDSSVKKVWQQQRGLNENIEGETLDRRQMRDRLAEDMAPIALAEGARIVNLDSDPDPTHKPEEASSFDNNSPTYVEPTDIYNED